jgi:hypothetical protein
MCALGRRRGAALDSPCELAVGDEPEARHIEIYHRVIFAATTRRPFRHSVIEDATSLADPTTSLRQRPWRPVARA